MRTVLLLALATSALLSCGSTGSSSAKKGAPDSYGQLERRTDVRLSEDWFPRAICAPGWKRDPDLDPFLVGSETEESAAEWGSRKASVRYAAYSAPGASVDEGLRIGAWRHGRWWVEPEWEELVVVRTDLAYGRAPGAATLTRLTLTPGGVTGREETDIRRFLTAAYGDKPNVYRDRKVAVVSDGWPADVELFDKRGEPLGRLANVDTKTIKRVECGYLVDVKRGEDWWTDLVDHAGAALREPMPFGKLVWYSAPDVSDQADTSMSYPNTYLIPVDTPPELLAEVKQRTNSTMGWPISLGSSTFLAPPEDCLGALRISSRTWAVWWQTPVGVRLSFSDTGDPDVEDMITSRDRARWLDWKVLWHQLSPHASDRWILAVAEDDGEGGQHWRAYHDADCEKATFLGLEPRDSLQAIERAFVMKEIQVWEDQARIDAERAEQQRLYEEAAREAALAAEYTEAAAAAAAAQAAANTIWMKDCPRCDGKGFLVSMREITTWYSPVATSGGMVRTSITSTQPHYDGLCGHCDGSGWVEAE